MGEKKKENHSVLEQGSPTENWVTQQEARGGWASKAPSVFIAIPHHSASPVAQLVKNPPVNARDAESLGYEDPLEKEWQPALVLLPGKSHGQRSLAGYSPWGCKESDVTGRSCTRAHTHSVTQITVWALPSVKSAAALDSYKSVNPTVNSPWEGSSIPPDQSLVPKRLGTAVLKLSLSWI